MSGSLVIGRTLVREVEVKSALSRSGLPEYDYALNPYVGCQHGCVYCYAREFTRGEPSVKWGEVVYVKVNLIRLLSREVRRFKPGVVGLSTITDPYQPVESRYKLSRRSIEILCRAGFHVSVQTKSALVVRDLDVLSGCGGMIDVGFTITTMRDTYRVIEPFAAHPMARASALRKVRSAGIETWIFLGPIIPGVNDHREDYEPIIKLASETNSQLIIDRFRPRPSVIKSMINNLGAVEAVSNAWWRGVVRDAFRLCNEYGINCMTAEDEWNRLRSKRQ
ncbi:MAG: radical SAM protein [Vulcanisaeta sp. AZ3]|jgi:DNA repair photolyase